MQSDSVLYSFKRAQVIAQAREYSELLAAHAQQRLDEKYCDEIVRLTNTHFSIDLSAIKLYYVSCTSFDYRDSSLKSMMLRRSKLMSVTREQYYALATDLSAFDTRKRHERNVVIRQSRKEREALAKHERDSASFDATLAKHNATRKQKLASARDAARLAKRAAKLYPAS